MLAIKAHPFRNDMAAKRIVKKAKLIPEKRKRNCFPPLGTRRVYSRNVIRLAREATSVPAPPTLTPTRSPRASCVKRLSRMAAGTLLMIWQVSAETSIVPWDKRTAFRAGSTGHGRLMPSRYLWWTILFSRCHGAAAGTLCPWFDGHCSGALAVGPACAENCRLGIVGHFRRFFHLFRKSCPNGSCSGNPVLCGASSLVLVGTIWMRYPLLCLSGAKLRLKMRPCNNATPDNHCNYRQHAATGFENHCFSEISLLFCSQTLNQ